MSLYSEIKKSFKDYYVRLALTDSGRELLDKLGPEYVVAMLEPLTLAHPTENFKVVLLTQDREPVFPLNGVDPSQVRPGVYSERVGVIHLRLNSRLATGTRQSFGILPSLDSYNGSKKFEVLRIDSKLRAFLSKGYYQLYKQSPLLLDLYRYRRAEKRFQAANFNPHPVLKPLGERRARPTRPVMWVAMHWLENGGAESWALEQIRVAKAAGFKVIVTADVPAPQRLFPQVRELADRVLLPASTLSDWQWTEYALNLIEKYQVTHLHIHHSAQAYHRLEELRLLYPYLHVEDSTHIVEYDQGGYVGASVRASNLIDLHHVISPALQERYLESGIAPEKVKYHPLTGFTYKRLKRPGRRPPEKTQPLRVGFLGRYNIQKRPFLFLHLVFRLVHMTNEKFEFYMQGSGELESNIHQLAKRLGVHDRIKFLPWGSAEEFAKQIDVLVIPSENEGLTLTTLEMDAHDVLVISADVGSQKTVVTPQMLLPRPAIKFLLSAHNVLLDLRRDRVFFAANLLAQHDQVDKVCACQSASDYYAEHYAEIIASFARAGKVGK